MGERKEMVLFRNPYLNGEPFTLINKDEIIRRVYAGESPIFLFPGKTEKDAAEIEEILDGYDEDEFEEILDSKDIPYEKEWDWVEVSDTLAYMDGVIETVDCWESARVFQYYDENSNLTSVCIEDMELIEIVVDDDFENLDSWDGNNWNFRDRFNHGRLYNLLEVDGEPVEGLKLLMEWSQWQGSLDTGEIITNAKAQEIREERE